MTLLNSVKIKLQSMPYAGPATCAPILQVVQASAFERAAVAAMSIKCQRADLKKARELIAKGMHDVAKGYLLSWKVERKNYKLLLTLGK